MVGREDGRSWEGRTPTPTHLPHTHTQDRMDYGGSFRLSFMSNSSEPSGDHTPHTLPATPHTHTYNRSHPHPTPPHLPHVERRCGIRTCGLSPGDHTCFSLPSQFDEHEQNAAPARVPLGSGAHNGVLLNLPYCVSPPPLPGHRAWPGASGEPRLYAHLAI